MEPPVLSFDSLLSPTSASDRWTFVEPPVPGPPHTRGGSSVPCIVLTLTRTNAVVTIW